MSEKWDLNAIASSLRWASLSRIQKAELVWRAKHQEEVMQVLVVLPGRYTYEQVDAAINASGVMPMDIYESLSANRHTIALARFYEVLNGPKQE